MLLATKYAIKTVEWVKAMWGVILSSTALISNVPLSCLGDEQTKLAQSVPFSAALLQALASSLLIARTTDVEIVLYVVLKGLITGWMHDDGLADCADVSVKRLTRKLSALKRWGISAFGGNILIANFLLEWVVLKQLERIRLVEISSASVAVGYFSMMWHWRTMNHAYDRTVRKPTRINLILHGLLLTLGLCLLLGNGALLVTAVMQTALLTAFNVWASKKLKGFTGDSLGAIKKLSEITSLLSLGV
ncbi:MAG: adenosylcobinamide-GDP ribazoletransferase [Candidatus Hodgkinia cicadicola]